MYSWDRLHSRARRGEVLADGAAVFGRHEEAAEIHARIARTYWLANMYDDAAASIMRASDCLMKANMPEDAFEGLRAASIMLVNVRQPYPAMQLVGYARTLETRYPNRFKNSSEPFRSSVYKMCKDRRLVD